MSGKTRPDVTIEQLLSKEVELVTIKQASDLTGFTIWDFYGKLADKICFVRLGEKAIRVIKEEVLQIAKPDWVTFADAARVTGAARSTLTQVAKEGRLQTVRVGAKKHIVRSSLMILLTELLPDWITAEDWFAEIIDAPRDLYSLTEIIEQFGEERTENLLQERKLRFINSPSGKRRHVSPASLMELVAQEEKATPELLAKLFDEPVEQIEVWRASGLLACPHHVHTDETLYKTCVIGILQRRLSKCFPAYVWYDSRQRNSERLASPEEAALFLQVSVPRILQLAEENRLRGLRTPDGRWKFTHHQLKKCRWDRVL
ncbi:MAG TPA: hypothetical protein VFO38_02790 [Candidatus Saccharimonadales bacterium]|nr:hypothetical protein [Candidatus Saccharimonadales bacterium]